jgi:hypothetical protein
MTTMMTLFKIVGVGLDTVLNDNGSGDCFVLILFAERRCSPAGG